MGCINLTMAIIDGEMKVAQYEHWHGSPDEQGAVVIEFIKDIMESPKSIKEAKAAIRNCSFASEEELTAYENGELEDSEENAYLDDSDIGAEILYKIWENGGCKLTDYSNTAANSLFCEWVYVVNFDTNKVEFYKGHNLHPLGERDRFYYLTDRALELCEGDRKIYYPVKQFAEYSFATLAKADISEIIDALLANNVSYYVALTKTFVDADGKVIEKKEANEDSDVGLVIALYEMGYDATDSQPEHSFCYHGEKLRSWMGLVKELMATGDTTNIVLYNWDAWDDEGTSPALFIKKTLSESGADVLIES